MRVGSLCTGIAGLELGLRLAGTDVEPVFVSDIDSGANEWLAANMPDTPNLGDFTQHSQLPPCDVLCAGFPCQPFSTAGKRGGTTDERYLFDDITRLLDSYMAHERPLVFLENVSGLLTSVSHGEHVMARVVYGLADIGYHITWGTLPAAAVGAPHRRTRWWGLAYPADTSRSEWRGPQQQHLPKAAQPTAESRERVSALAERFGQWAPAINRWEHILGRTAPDPASDGRISPAFVEWMMGYPAGWVTDTLTTRKHALKALGNSVVPQCAAEAFTQLHNRMTHATT